MDVGPGARRNLPPERADAELQPCETIAASFPPLRRTEQNKALLLLSWVTNPSYRTNPSYQPLAPTLPTDPPVAHRWKSVGLLPAAREES